MLRLRTAVISVALLTACASVLAQYGGARRGGAEGREGRSRQGAVGEMSETTRMTANDQIRMQLTGARNALKLAAEQGPAWQDYENRVIALLDDLSRGASMPSGEGALKQIDRKVDLARNRLAAMEDLSDAAGKLYAILSSAQKTVADRMLPGTVPVLYAGQPRGSASALK